LCSAGLSQIIVSLDSPHPEKHDAIRDLKGLYQRAVAGIRLAKECGIGIRVNTVVGPHNYRDMVLLQETLNALDVDQWELSALKMRKHQKYDSEDNVLKIGKMVYARKILPMGVKWYGNDEDSQRLYFDHGIPPRPKNRVCDVTRDVTYFDAKNGTFYPCSCLPHRDNMKKFQVKINVEKYDHFWNDIVLESQRKYFYRLGSSICSGCSSTAAGYGERVTSLQENTSWDY
jgi:cytosylglucuronate decarboxylase